MRLDCLFISRKGRKGELRTITENYPTQNANPQTLAITGVSADCVYCAKRMRHWGLNPHLHALVAELLEMPQNIKRRGLHLLVLVGVAPRTGEVAGREADERGGTPHVPPLPLQRGEDRMKSVAAAHSRYSAQESGVSHTRTLQSPGRCALSSPKK